MLDAFIIDVLNKIDEEKQKESRPFLEVPSSDDYNDLDEKEDKKSNIVILEL